MSMTPRWTHLVFVSLALGCGAEPEASEGGDGSAGGGGGGKADDIEGDTKAAAVYADILAQDNPDHANLISQAAFAAMFRSEMGDTHQDFHSLRRWYLMAQPVRQRLLAQGKDGSQLLQEGDPDSGLEFCVMHGAMIDMLANSFPCTTGIERSCLGDFAIETDTVDPSASVFLGWGSDEELLAQLQARGVGSAAVASAQAAIDAIDAAMASGAFEAIAADPASGISSAEDAMCLFMQTSLRLGSWEEFAAAQQQGQIGPDSDARFYRRATENDVGIHNSLHGMLMSPGSAIDVGSPMLNLYNSLFWGIHGWVEFKWREARRTWYPNCGDAPGVLWGGDADGAWDPADDRETIIENCGESYYYEVTKWGLSHGIHFGHNFRVPEPGTMGADCDDASPCGDGLVCTALADDSGSLCLSDPDRDQTPSSPEGIAVETIFESTPVDRTDCPDGATDCGEPVAALEPGHPSLPAPN